MADSCPHREGNTEQVIAWVRGDLEGDELAAFDRHQKTCPRCQKEVSQYRAVETMLKQEAANEPCEDMVDDVMERVAKDTWRRRHRLAWARIAGAAAGMLVAVGVAVWLRPGENAAPADTTTAGALAWLAEQQTSDGSWVPEQWGGRKDYRVALTSMSLMALLQRDGRYGKACDDAAKWILSQQQPDGRFGPAGEPMMYNQGIATVALLEYCATRADEMPDTVRLAVDFVRTMQRTDGGWGYGVDDEANTAITVWQLRALALAETLGMADDGAYLRRGLRWLSRRGDSRGEFAYAGSASTTEPTATLTAMGAYSLMTAGLAYNELQESRDNATTGLHRVIASVSSDADYYALYFIAKAAEASGDSGADALGNIKRRVHERCESAGPLAGTWAPDDTWSPVGGRLYTTAMAALVMGAG